MGLEALIEFFLNNQEAKFNSFVILFLATLVILYLEHHTADLIWKIITHPIKNIRYLFIIFLLACLLVNLTLINVGNIPTPSPHLNIDSLFIHRPSSAISEITIDNQWKDNCISEECSKYVYNPYIQTKEDNSFIDWRYPHGNNGENQLGRDLTGAKQITFWARGEKGSEDIQFFAGQISGIYPDTIDWRTDTELVLGNEWKQYSIPLNGQNLTHIIRGFGFKFFKNNNPKGATIYLDDIQYEW